MKLTAFAAIAASAVLVSASPLRVVVVSSSSVQRTEPFPVGALRFGHAAAGMNPEMPVANLMGRPGQAPDAKHRRPCMGRFKQKAVEVSNSFRKIFGFPLIESGDVPHGKEIHGGMVQILPFIPNGGAPTMAKIEGEMHHGGGWYGKTKGGDRINIVTAADQGRTVPIRVHHSHPHFHHSHHQRIDDSFLVRIQNALMALGPWEGRAVAFVLGCGLGVLLRMFWVLSVVMYRSLRGTEEHEYEEVLVFDVDENEVRRTPASAPPPYIYPVDEKADVKTPAEVEPAQN